MTQRRLRPLPDCIGPGVQVLLVGINPGMRSAEIGHHFAGYSNRFWKLLYDSRLVPEPIGTEEDRRLPEWRYGITNLVARPTPGIGDLRPEEYLAGRVRLVAKIRRHKPAVVALVGVTLYRALFPRGRGADGTGGGAEAASEAARPGRTKGAGAELALARNRTERASPRKRPEVVPARSVVGLRPEKLGGADVFVLPNPSGRNANFSYAEMLDAFRALKRYVDALPR